MRDLLLRRRNLLMKKQELNIRAVCFEADGEQTVSITKVGSSAPIITMQYSYDGVNWDAWNLSALQFGGSTKVYIRGIGNTRFGADTNNYNTITFSTNSFVYVSGIVESLLDGENEVAKYSESYTFSLLFYKQIALREADRLKFETISISEWCYITMFGDCTNLLYAPKVLPATTLISYCYRSMFSGCTSLVNAPELPATTLKPYCYGYMFEHCTSLTTAPELPATTLVSNCYNHMFYDCTSLVNAPELPATTLISFCYDSMFYDCTSLVNAPELPATTLKSYCYRYLFLGCTSLKTIRCRAKQKERNATYQWLSGVYTAGTLYGHSEFGWPSGAAGIPSGWEFVELTD